MLWSRFGILDVRLGNPIFDLGFPKAWDAVFQTGDSGINWIGNFALPISWKYATSGTLNTPKPRYRVSGVWGC